MAFNFRQSATDATTLSELMNNRDKASTEYMIETYPQGFTVMSFDLIQTSDGAEYPVFNIAEDENIFYAGGSILNKIAHQWIDGFGGDIVQANHDLQETGGLAIKLEESRTKKGNSLTRVVIL
jgi:hypothetical protein